MREYIKRLLWHLDGGTRATTTKTPIKSQMGKFPSKPTASRGRSLTGGLFSPSVGGPLDPVPDVGALQKAHAKLGAR